MFTALEMTAGRSRRSARRGIDYRESHAMLPLATGKRVWAAPGVPHDLHGISAYTFSGWNEIVRQPLQRDPAREAPYAPRSLDLRALHFFF